ncbi:hypothetical protein [Sphingomonas sp. RS2018]
MSEMAVRKLSRLGNELLLTSSYAAAHFVADRYDWGVVLLVLLKRCADDWIDDDDVLRRPEALTRRSSINAIAASLDRPYATIHRHVMSLIGEGLVVQVDGGVAVSNDPAVADRIVALLTLAHDSLVRLAEDFAGEVEFPAPPSVPVRDLHKRILLAAFDVLLVPFEYAREPVMEWTSKLVWIVIIVANVRHITIDPVLADRYAYDPTPDALRRPIGARAIAKLTGLSYGTVYRHCRLLAELDVIRYDGTGWLTVTNQLFNPDVDHGVIALLGYFNRRLIELVAAGLDMDAVASFYLAGRPPYGPVEA